MQSNLEKSLGFALMLLKPEPEFPQEYGGLNGVREDFNGVGVFLYKSHTRKPGKWVSHISSESIYSIVVRSIYP